MKTKTKIKQLKLLDLFKRIWKDKITDWKNFYSYSEIVADLEFENLDFLV